MNLIDLPADILLHVFKLLSVEDLLALEQACTTLRTAIATRHLWLVKLRLLGQSCAPDLPSVDVRSLSYSELRCAVTKAIRWNKACKRELAKSRETLINSALMDTRQLNLPIYMPIDMDQWHVKLAPGGKYLVVEKNGFKVLSVKTGACICQWDSTRMESRFALESLSERTLLVFQTFANLENRTVLDLFQVDCQSEVDSDVWKIATTQTQSNRGFTYTTPCIALGSGFGVINIGRNSTSLLLIWNWQTRELMEVSIGKSTFLEDMQIANGWLFYVLRVPEGLGRFSLGAICLHQLSFKSSAIDFMDVQKWSTKIRFPDEADKNFDALNLAASSDPFRFLNTTQICVAAVARTPIWGRGREHIAVARFTFNRGDVSNVCDTNDSAFNLVSLTYKRVPLTGENTALFLSVCAEATAHRSGLFIIKSQEVGISCLDSARRYFWLVGMDECGDVFLSPLCQAKDKLGVQSRFLLDEYSGAMVRLMSRKRTVCLYTHYAP